MLTSVLNMQLSGVLIEGIEGRLPPQQAKSLSVIFKRPSYIGHIYMAGFTSLFILFCDTYLTYLIA